MGLSNFSINPFKSNMFRSKTLDVITLFHKPSVAASTRVANLLKTASAHASATATEDQASDHTPQNKAVARSAFELEITEAAPTADQLRSIFEYLGSGKAGQLVKGAASESDALKKLKESGDNFERPVIVDWNQGKAIAGENESEILKMLRELPKQD
jgi:arsenate reductase-like glutaredoxin family protein